MSGRQIRYGDSLRFGKISCCTVYIQCILSFKQTRQAELDIIINITIYTSSTYYIRYAVYMVYVTSVSSSISLQLAFFSSSFVTLLTGPLSTIHYREEAESRGLTQRLLFIDLFGASISKTNALRFTLLRLPSLSCSSSFFFLLSPHFKIYHSARLKLGGPCLLLLLLPTLQLSFCAPFFLHYSSHSTSFLPQVHHSYHIHLFHPLYLSGSISTFSPSGKEQFILLEAVWQKEQWGLVTQWSL